jgi:hypothetical protein
MKDRRLLLAIAVLVLALLAGIGWSLRDRFEKVDVDVETGYQGPARVNPLLAAEQLYTNLGATARTLPGALVTLPPADHAILLVSERRSINEAQMNALKDWVERGGRLVVALDEAPSLDPILAWLGVHVQGDREKEPGSEVLEMDSRSGPAPIEAPKAPRLVDSRKESNFSVGSATGKFLLRFSFGGGRVIVLSDASFLTNDHIGQKGHARAAWAIVNAQTPPKGVWIVVHEDMPTLLGLITRHAPAALLSSVLLLAAWLWLAGARFGPIAPDPSRDRRSLLEHIEATGDLLLRIGRGEDLAQAARAAVLRRVELREPETAKLPAAALVQRLATVARIAPKRVDAALNGAITGPADLVSTVQTLETVRRSL